jgi:NAD(P)H-nitrite reductase large subunit
LKYVIIGNSTAAVGAVTGIRKIDADGEIVIISKEKYLAYSRPSISSLLAGKITMEKMPYRKENFYKDNNVKVMLEKEVVSIDTKGKKIKLDDKKAETYDRLLIATGGKPFVPPIKGLTKDDTLTFTTLDDSLRLKELSGKLKSVVIIGGGLIGLKAAEGLIKTGIDVTVVELAPRVLSTAFDNVTSKIIQDAFIKKGVKVITGDTVSEVTKKSGKITGVNLKSGNKLKCAAVVVAIGVVPNTDIVKDGNIKIKRGLVIDDNMMTSAKNVYAAGDVTEGYDMILDAKRVLPIWTNAFVQGKVAGINMAGRKLSFKKLLPMNSITFCDIPIISMGLTEPLDGKGYKVLERNDLRNKVHKRLILKDNVIVGGCFVTNIDRTGIFTGLIKDKVDVSDYIGYLLEDDFSFVCLKKELRKKRMESVNRSLI